MVTLTRLQQDSRSECYQVRKNEDTVGRLFVFFSHDYLFLDGYLYLDANKLKKDQDKDDLADEAIVQYLNNHCPMDYGEDYTSFEVNIINNGESYLVELGDDLIYDDEFEEEGCECEEEGCEC